MPYFDKNISSNVYDASIGSEMLRPVRTINDIKTPVILSSCFLKRMQKQGNKRRSIISILCLYKIFGKHFTVLIIFADIAAYFMKPFSLP